MSDKTFNAFIRNMYEGGSAQEFFDSEFEVLGGSDDEMISFDSDEQIDGGNESEDESGDGSDDELITQYNDVPINAEGGAKSKLSGFTKIMMRLNGMPEIDEQEDFEQNNETQINVNMLDSDLITYTPDPSENATPSDKPDSDEDEEEYAYYIKAKKGGSNSVQKLVKKNKVVKPQDVRSMLERLDLTL